MGEPFPRRSANKFFPHSTMQAIFPISMVIAVLAAIGIIFLLPSLLLSRTSGDYAVVPSHSTVGLGRTNISAANWGGTGAIAGLNTLNPFARLLGNGNPAGEDTMPNGGSITVVAETPNGLEVVNVIPQTSMRSTRPFPKGDKFPNSLKNFGKGPNALAALEQKLGEQLYEKTGAYPRNHFIPSLNQRRSRRRRN